MLPLIIPKQEYYDNETSTFITIEEVELELEHSLVSLSKWESRFEKPFLGGKDKTEEETIGYVEAMVITKNVDLNVLKGLSRENMVAINDYLASSQSATTFSDRASKMGASGRGEVITSELIYYWMVSLNVSFEAETWNLNRLFNLLRILNVKSSNGPKPTKSQIQARNRELNAQRREQLNTRG